MKKLIIITILLAGARVSAVEISGTYDGQAITWIGWDVGDCFKSFKRILFEDVFRYRKVYVQAIDYGWEPGNLYAAAGEGVREPRLIEYEEEVERLVTTRQKAIEEARGHLGRHGSKYLSALLGGALGAVVQHQQDDDSTSGEILTINGDGNCVGQCDDVAGDDFQL